MTDISKYHLYLPLFEIRKVIKPSATLSFNAFMQRRAGFSGKHILRQSVACEILYSTVLGITTCGKERKEAELCKGGSQAAIEAPPQPQLTSWESLSQNGPSELLHVEHSSLCLG